MLDRYLEDAGLTREQAVGFRFWQGDADSYYAILPKGSEIETKLSELLDWEKGRKLTLQASFPRGSTLNDRIQIHALVQTGWVIN